MFDSTPDTADRTLENPGGTGFKLEPFADYAWREIEACPLSEPGVCRNPDCRKQFCSTRDFKVYCSQSCREKDKREFRKIGAALAPALLAARMGKHAESGSDEHELAKVARRYVDRSVTEWLADRKRRGRGEVTR